MTPVKVNGWLKFEKLAYNKIRFPLNFENPRNFYMKSANFVLFRFYNVFKDTIFTVEIEDGREAPLKP